MEFRRIRPACHIRGLIFDWAGTTVDYGCFAPLEVFLAVFNEIGIGITLEEARGPMGLPKIDHIRTLTKLPRIEALWLGKYGKAPDENDVIKLYERFEPALLGILHNYAEPIDGVIDTVSQLRNMGLKIGSTTGYTKSMMDIVIPAAASKGYSPDACFPPDGLAGGRPAPWMCYRNAEALGIYPMSSIIKAGDTIADIHEGVNAGCYSVGIIEGSSEMGLRKAEFDALSPNEIAIKKAAVKERFFEAGAHFVVDTIREVPALVEFINTSVQNDRQ